MNPIDMLEAARTRLPPDAHPVDRLSWLAYLNENIAPIVRSLGDAVPAPHPLAQAWMRVVRTTLPAPAAWTAWLRWEEGRELVAMRIETAYSAWLITRALDEVGRESGWKASIDLAAAIRNGEPIHSAQSDTDVVALTLLLHVVRHAREPEAVVEALGSIRRTRLWRMTLASAPRRPEAA